MLKVLNNFRPLPRQLLLHLRCPPYNPDIIVNDQYIIEMKSISKITEKETNQLGRYLDIFNMQTGYLININHKNYEVKRVEGKKRFDAAKQML